MIPPLSISLLCVVYPAPNAVVSVVAFEANASSALSDFKSKLIPKTLLVSGFGLCSRTDISSSCSVLLDKTVTLSAVSSIVGVPAADTGTHTREIVSVRSRSKCRCRKKRE